MLAQDIAIHGIKVTVLKQKHPYHWEYRGKAMSVIISERGILQVA